MKSLSVAVYQQVMQELNIVKWLYFTKIEWYIIVSVIQFGPNLKKWKKSYLFTTDFFWFQNNPRSLLLVLKICDVSMEVLILLLLLIPYIVICRTNTRIARTSRLDHNIISIRKGKENLCLRSRYAVRLLSVSCLRFIKIMLEFEIAQWQFIPLSISRRIK